MKRFSGVLVLSLSLIATIPPGATGAQPSDDDLADALRFRRSFHLDAGEALVRRSFQDRDQFPDDAWGVPLTTDEAADMAARLRRQDAATAALEWAAEQPQYGGAYIDQAQDALPIFLFTGGLASARDRIAELLPDHPFRVERVERTFDELLETVDLAFDEHETLIDLGVPVISLAPDEVLNGLTFVVEQSSSEMRSLLQERYDMPVSLKVGRPLQLDCAGYDSCDNPLKGGIRIDRNNWNEENPLCTSSWIARKSEGDGARVLVTAGHCIENNGGTGPNINWKHDGAVFGNAVGKKWPVGGIVAVGIISIDEWTSGQSQNRLHFRSPLAGSTAQVYPIVATKSNNAQVKGLAICRSGARRKLRCGKIERRHEALVSVGRQMTDMWVVDFDGDGGDSGGPYFTSTSEFGDAATAFGIHSGSDEGWNPNGGEGWYSTVQNVDAETA